MSLAFYIPSIGERVKFNRGVEGSGWTYGIVIETLGPQFYCAYLIEEDDGRCVEAWDFEIEKTTPLEELGAAAE